MDDQESMTVVPWQMEDADAAELGVRPFGWEDPLESLYFGKEQSSELTVGVANGLFIPFDDDEEEGMGKKKRQKVSDDYMSDDEESDCERDPETGEKIFRNPSSVEALPPRVPSSPTWIQDYLSNFDTTSSSASLVVPQVATTTTTTTVGVEEDISTSDTSWLNEQLLFLSESSPERNSARALLRLDSDPFLLLSSPDTLDPNLNFLPSSSTIPPLPPLPATTDMNLAQLPLPLLELKPLSSSASLVDSSFYFAATSPTSFSPSTRSLLSLDSDTTTQESTSDSRSNDMIVTKIEKIDREDDSSSSSTSPERGGGQRRRSRLHHTGQADEELLRKYNVPIALEQITETSTEEYNHLLARLVTLSPEQIHIVKDMTSSGQEQGSSSELPQAKSGERRNLGRRSR